MFSVIAGKYDGDDLNCKYSDDFDSLDDAIAAFDKVKGYPWAFIQYKGRVLELFWDGYDPFRH